MTIEEIDPSKLHFTDIHRSTLSSCQESRVRSIADAVSEVYPMSITEWLHGFRCDLHPEREIAIWEVIALAYSSFVNGKGLPIGAKNEVLELVLSKSFGRTNQQVLEETTELITADDRSEILCHFAAAAKALGILDQFAQ